MTFGLVKFLNSKKPSAHVAKPNSFTTASQIIRYLFTWLLAKITLPASFLPAISLILSNLGIIIQSLVSSRKKSP